MKKKCPRARGQVWTTDLGSYYLVVAPFSHMGGLAWLCMNLDAVFDSPSFRRMA